MRALIAGGGGQVGRALAATAPAGIEAVALGRDRLDIADPTSIAAALATLRPEIVINAAGYTAVDAAEQACEAAYLGNRDAPARLAAAAASHGARFIHLSSDFVFDGAASIPYAPEHPPAPLGVYGRSKAAGEAAVREAASDALIVRTAWVYAADGSNFMQTMLRLMAERSQIEVVADQIGTPTHALSLARALWTLAQAGATGLHHFTDAGVASRYDFAVAIQEEALALALLDRCVPILPIRSADHPTPARRPMFGVLDKSATYAILGAPARHWRSELRAALAGLKEAHG